MPLRNGSWFHYKTYRRKENYGILNKLLVISLKRNIKFHIARPRLKDRSTEWTDFFYGECDLRD